MSYPHGSQRALLKASLRRWKSRLRENNRHVRLLSFEEVHRSGAATSRYAPSQVTPWNSSAATDEPSRGKAEASAFPLQCRHRERLPERVGKAFSTFRDSGATRVSL